MICQMMPWIDFDADPFLDFEPHFAAKIIGSALARSGLHGSSAVWLILLTALEF